MSSKVSMFENAQNIHFKDSFLTVAERSVKQDKLDVFLKTASLNAILNAGGRADEVRCYPGTRKEIIGKIERWMDGHGEADRRMLWLSGHAGAGKSAIAQTLAERGAEREIPIANFFFFRGDNTRNHAQPLVATLIYQLVDFYPALRKHLTTILAAKPLMHKASVEEQFSRLLASPVQNIRQSASIGRKTILIIDGLDECTDEVGQVQILSALHALVSRASSPFRVMVASRAEPHLVMFFNKIGHSVESIFLNDEYRPEADIRLFVIAKFDDIKRTHHLARTLSKYWPTSADIEKIASKSSGQFIYAATVMRFIEYSRDSPSLNLLIVHQLRPPTSHSPFALLDPLYSHVFSKARDIRLIKWALALHNQLQNPYKRGILDAAGYEITELESLFADISAVARISINHSFELNVDFYHASLPDYLKDKSRSGIYHVPDEEEMVADVLTFSLQKFHDSDSFDSIVFVMRLLTEPTPELSRSLLDASKRKLGPHFEHPGLWDLFTQIIFQLYFKTDKVLCGHILRSWARFAYTHNFDPALQDEYRRGKAAYIYYDFLRAIEKAKFVLKRALKI